MTEIHIHGPAIIHVDSETPVTAPTVSPAEKRDSGPKLHWRTWPEEVPKTGAIILMRVDLFGCFYYVAGYLDGVDFVDSSGRPVFRDDPDDEDTVFERRTPDEFQWIPLGDLLGDLIKEDK